MAYTKTVWENAPSTATPINAAKMNNIEDGIEALDTAYSGLLNFFYPVGTIYETTSTDLDTTTKMANHFGGTWEAYGAGRVLVAKSTDTEFDTLGEEGGEKTHTLTIEEMPSHRHEIVYGNGTETTTSRWELPAATWRSGNAKLGDNPISWAGSSRPHNNLQPYIVVYRYRRTA